jgi:hypothetical protein
MWMTPSEAAKALHMHPDTLARKVERGDLIVDVARANGGHRRYRRSDVEREAAGGSAFDHPLIEEMAPRLRNTVSNLGVVIPTSEINRLFASRWDILGDMKVADATDIDEDICRVVARELAGRDTPTYGDGTIVSGAFYQRLHGEALARGWGFTSEPDDQEFDWTDIEAATARVEQERAEELARQEAAKEAFWAAMPTFMRPGTATVHIPIPGIDDAPVDTEPETQGMSIHELDKRNMIVGRTRLRAGGDRPWEAWKGEDPSRRLEIVFVDSQGDQEAQMNVAIRDVAEGHGKLIIGPEQYAFVCRTPIGSGEVRIYGVRGMLLEQLAPAPPTRLDHVLSSGS